MEYVKWVEEYYWQISKFCVVLQGYVVDFELWVFVDVGLVYYDDFF